MMPHYIRMVMPVLFFIIIYHQCFCQRIIFWIQQLVLHKFLIFAWELKMVKDFGTYIHFQYLKYSAMYIYTRTWSQNIKYIWFKSFLKISKRSILKQLIFKWKMFKTVFYCSFENSLTSVLNFLLVVSLIDPINKSLHFLVSYKPNL